VGWTKDAFFGDAALRAEKERGPDRLLRGLKAAGRGIPRPGMLVHDNQGDQVGFVTSGTYSPTLKTGIALALLKAELTDGDGVFVDIRGRSEPFVITKPPFVTAGVREP
jgi:aminomethyltransferase